MPPRIFISYRRADSQAVTNRIYDWLARDLGQGAIFKDVDNIPPGRDFRGVLRESTAQCHIMLVVIGKHWVDATDKNGNRRLDNSNDFVRIEIETGLQRDGIIIIPLLIDGADMPTDTQLPDSLKELAYKNAFVIHDDPIFKHDMETLIRYLRSLMRGSGGLVRYIAAALLLIVLFAALAFIVPSLFPVVNTILTPTIPQAAIFPSHTSTDVQTQPSSTVITEPSLTYTPTFEPSNTFIPTDLPSNTPLPTPTPTTVPSNTFVPTNRPSNTPLPLSAAQEPVTITWFVGLGTGTNSEQIEIQNQVVADFNASHPNINLVINIAASNETARNTLNSLLAAGTPPDIIGPVGESTSSVFGDLWANIMPLVESTGFDTSVFDQALLEMHRTESGGLSALPFMVYPSTIYYNEDLFDEAGLNYPPTEFGAPYVMPDGTEAPWNYDTVAEIAKILTVDANGNDATSADFDPAAVEQYGMNFQWARIRLIWTNLQPSSYYDSETNTVTVPDEWRQASQWYWDRIWADHTAPNATAAASEVLQPSGFASGNLAMSIVPLWYTCCLDNSVGNYNWNIAPVPASFDGEQHVAVDYDTFRIVEASLNKAAAFEVLTYLITEAAPTLVSAYGGYPALPTSQPIWVEAISARYPLGVNWDVASASLSYSNPAWIHHGSSIPNFSQVYDREFALLSLIEGDTGVEMDIDAEIDTFQSDLQAIVEGS